MKVNQLLKSFIENRKPIIACFLISFVLYIIYNMSLIDNQTLLIPLTIQQEGAVECVSEVPKTIKIHARTSASNVIHADDIKATLNLDYLTSTGTYDVPVTITLSDDLLSMDPLEIKKNPETISVHAETKISGAALLDVPVSGTVAHGYELIGVSVIPNMIFVMGPESIVKNTTTIYTDAVSVEGLSSSKVFPVTVRNLNKKLDLEANDNYSVSVTIVPVIEQKEFSKVFPVYKNLNPDFVFDASDNSPVSIVLSGPQILLENMVDEPFNFDVDLGFVTEPGEYLIPVQVDVSSGLSLSEISVNEWKVTVTEKLKTEEAGETSDSISSGE